MEIPVQKFMHAWFVGTAVVGGLAISARSSRGERSRCDTEQCAQNSCWGNNMLECGGGVGKLSKKRPRDIRLSCTPSSHGCERKGTKPKMLCCRISSYL